MVSRCANPSCGAQFKYLHEGRLYHFVSNDKRVGPPTSQSSVGVPFWWLCARCCLAMALIHDGKSRVTLVPLHNNRDTSQNHSEERELPYEQTAHLGC